MENKKIVEKKLRKVKSSIFIVKPQSYFEDKWHTKGIELTLDLSPWCNFSTCLFYVFDFVLTVFCTIGHICKSIITYWHEPCVLCLLLLFF